MRFHGYDPNVSLVTVDPRDVSLCTVCSVISASPTQI